MSDTDERVAAYRLGLSAETAAAWLLRLTGHWVLDRRARMGSGEIDIVARDRQTLIFVEVKARRTIEAALEAVGRKAQTRIANAADLWVEMHPDYAHLDRRYDIVAVLPGKLPVHVREAFWPGDWM